MVTGPAPRMVLNHSLAAPASSTASARRCKEPGSTSAMARIVPISAGRQPPGTNATRDASALRFGRRVLAQAFERESEGDLVGEALLEAPRQGGVAVGQHGR